MALLAATAIVAGCGREPTDPSRTNLAGIWYPHGNATLSPGEGFIIDNNSDGPFTITFVGLVPQGQQTIPVAASGYRFISAKLPQAGSISSVVGYTTPHDGDTILRWSVARSSSPILTLASFPNPVLMP